MKLLLNEEVFAKTFKKKGITPLGYFIFLKIVKLDKTYYSKNDLMVEGWKTTNRWFIEEKLKKLQNAGLIEYKQDIHPRTWEINITPAGRGVAKLIHEYGDEKDFKAVADKIKMGILKRLAKPILLKDKHFGKEARVIINTTDINDIIECYVHNYHLYHGTDKNYLLAPHIFFNDKVFPNMWSEYIMNKDVNDDIKKAYEE